MKRIIMLVCAFLLLSNGATFAQQVGQVVALKGKATISRSTKTIDARVKSSVELKDTVNTAVASRVKLLFIDDSVLTLGDSSSMSISEFIHSRSDRGKSLFNLFDGKMRAVVGKTMFEVKTPTAVAAARGTVIYFEVGILNGKRYTKIICLEGKVEVRSLVDGDTGILELIPGMMVIIMESERIGVSVPASAEEIERARRETTLSGSEISLPTPKLPEPASIGVFAAGKTTPSGGEISPPLSKRLENVSTGVFATGVYDIDLPTIVPLFEQQVPPITVTPRQPTSVVIDVNF